MDVRHNIISTAQGSEDIAKGHQGRRRGLKKKATNNENPASPVAPRVENRQAGTCLTVPETRQRNSQRKTRPFPIRWD